VFVFILAQASSGTLLEFKPVLWPDISFWHLLESMVYFQWSQFTWKPKVPLFFVFFVSSAFFSSLLFFIAHIQSPGVLLRGLQGYLVAAATAVTSTPANMKPKVA